MRWTWNSISGHPAFLVGHVPPGVGNTLWAVNFNGPLHHHPLHGLPRLILRHLYGDVTTVASDNTAPSRSRRSSPQYPP
jgi:hypothetical protein